MNNYKNHLQLDDVTDYVEKNIKDFHNRKIDGLNKLKIEHILKRKNPYLFRTKNLLTSEQIVKNMLNSHISSTEETLFGNWLEQLAIFINHKVYGGYKSSSQGVDLEFTLDNKRYIVAVKSGPNWGNSSQIKKMISDFKTASRILKTSNANIEVVAICGCCYGIEKNFEKDGYLKYCGQKFWELISDEKDLYIDIIEPLGKKAKENNDKFNELFIQTINSFTKSFSSSYCSDDGKINWDELVKFNSGFKY